MARTSATAAEAARLSRAGESVVQVARRLDKDPEAIARALHRAGRTDLAREYWREANYARRPR